MKPGRVMQDSPEEIKACLSCEKEECVNCLRYRYSDTKRKAGRPGSPLAAIKGDECIFFNSIKEAAEAFGITQSAIYSAINNKHRCKDYYWRYI